MGRGGVPRAGLLEVQFQDKLSSFSEQELPCLSKRFFFFFFPSPIPFLIVIFLLCRTKGPSLLAGLFVYFAVESSSLH